MASSPRAAGQPALRRPAPHVGWSPLSRPSSAPCDVCSLLWGPFLSTMASLPLSPAPQSLVREPLSRRRQLLRENFVETEGEFVFATSLDTKDMDQIAEFLEQSVKGEGAAPLPTAGGAGLQLLRSRSTLDGSPRILPSPAAVSPGFTRAALCLLRLLRGADGENPGRRCHLRDRQEITQLAQGDCAPRLPAELWTRTLSRPGR